MAVNRVEKKIFKLIIITKRLPNNKSFVKNALYK